MTSLPKILHIPDTTDVVVIKLWIREQWERFYPKIPLLRLDRANLIVDDLYLETQQRKFKEAEMLNAYVDPSPDKKMLTKFGLDQNRHLLVSFSTLHLDEAGILEPNNDTYLIGDLIIFDGDRYEIKEQVRDKKGIWANTNIPLFILCTCDRFREGR